MHLILCFFLLFSRTWIGVSLFVCARVCVYVSAYNVCTYFLWYFITADRFVYFIFVTINNNEVMVMMIRHKFYCNKSIGIKVIRPIFPFVFCTNFRHVHELISTFNNWNDFFIGWKHHPVHITPTQSQAVCTNLGRKQPVLNTIFLWSLFFFCQISEKLLMLLEILRCLDFAQE